MGIITKQGTNKITFFQGMLKIGKNATSTNKHAFPTGSKYSPFFATLTTSTGTSSLDRLLGDGIPVGSIMLVREDEGTKYAQTLLKAFISQGIFSNHQNIVISPDSERILSTLPSKKNDSSTETIVSSSASASSKSVQSENQEAMKIAWRYQNNPLISQNFNNLSAESFCIPMDLSKNLSKETFTENIFSIDFTSGDSHQFDVLYEGIEEVALKSHK